MNDSHELHGMVNDAFGVPIKVTVDIEYSVEDYDQIHIERVTYMICGRNLPYKLADDEYDLAVSEITEILLEQGSHEQMQLSYAPSEIDDTHLNPYGDRR